MVGRAHRLIQLLSLGELNSSKKNSCLNPRATHKQNLTNKNEIETKRNRKRNKTNNIKQRELAKCRLPYAAGATAKIATKGPTLLSQQRDAEARLRLNAELVAERDQFMVTP